MAGSPPTEPESDSRRQAAAGHGAAWICLCRRPTFCARFCLFPPSMPALDLLVKMQATRTHMALVIDEYGGTEGLASIEDIVEMIVGDIEDEHDSRRKPRRSKPPRTEVSSWTRAPVLSEVFRAIDADLAAISDAEEVETLGGSSRPSPGMCRRAAKLLSRMASNSKWWTPTRAASSGSRSHGRRGSAQKANYGKPRAWRACPTRRPSGEGWINPFAGKSFRAWVVR